MIPLAAVVFHSVGRHPLAGLAAAFAGVSGGYSANILIGTIDPLLAGITSEAAALIDPRYGAETAEALRLEVNPMANYYFMCISTFVITLLGTLVTTKIVEPKLGTYDGANAQDDVEEMAEGIGTLDDKERRGLKLAGLAVLAMIGLVAALA